MTKKTNEKKQQQQQPPRKTKHECRCKCGHTHEAPDAEKAEVVEIITIRNKPATKSPFFIQNRKLREERHNLKTQVAEARHELLSCVHWSKSKEWHTEYGQSIRSVNYDTYNQFGVLIPLSIYPRPPGTYTYIPNPCPPISYTRYVETAEQNVDSFDFKHFNRALLEEHLPRDLATLVGSYLAWDIYLKDAESNTLPSDTTTTAETESSAAAAATAAAQIK